MSSELGSPGSRRPSHNFLPEMARFAPPLGVQRLYEFGLYSSYHYAAATNMANLAQSQLFTYTNGGTGVAGFATASVSETNMYVGSQLPGGESYECAGVAVEVLGGTNAAILMGDLRTIMRLGVVLWQFTNTYLYIAPIPMVGAAGGIYGFSADSGTPVTVGNNGNGNNYWIYNNLVVVIPALQQFTLVIQWGNAGQAGAMALTAAVDIRITLFNNARSAVAAA